MTLAAVLGQERAVAALTATLKNRSVHHAYLFAGQEGVGKELAALGVAQALLCESRPLEGCGTCPACVRVARRNHPDVMWVMPEEEQVRRKLAGRADFDHTPSRDIRVEQVRKLQERLVLRPLEGAWKIAIVCSAEQLNPQAQNAFLKTLEEPPQNTVLILISSAPDRLLPTLRSRCAKVSFAPLSMALIAKRVAADLDVAEPDARLVAAMSGGSLARALSMDVKSLARRRGVIETFEGLGQDGRALLSFASEYGEGRAEAEDALEILTLWTRDLLLTQAGQQGLVNQDLADLAKATAMRHSPRQLLLRQELSEQTRAAISGRNGQPRLQLEGMLIRLGEAG